MHLVLFFACFANAWAADWLSSAADAKRTRFQMDETDLSRETAPDLKLLWKLQFDEAITSPVVLGPIFTHRGIKELVFFAGAKNNLYAVDADLARVFWKRHFDTKAETMGFGCKEQLTAGPVLAPYYGNQVQREDVATPRRTLFILTSDGQLHSVRPADAHDLALPIQFVPAGSLASDLTLSGNVIATSITGGCEQPKSGEWSVRVGTVPGKATVTVAKAENKTALANGYEVGVVASGLTARRNGMIIWSVNGLVNPLAPVIANGLVFTVSGNALLAYDLTSGVRVYSSGVNGTVAASANLALANGHVYFIAGDTIFCYGFPLEI